MAATEANLWQWLRGARKALGDSLSMRRVENAVGIGDGDVDLVWNGRPGDIELKAARRPKRASTVIRHEPVKAGQVDYADEVLKAGGAHAFLIGVGEGRARRFYLVHGKLGRWLQAFRTEEELGRFGVEVFTPAEAVEKATEMKGPYSDEY